MATIKKAQTGTTAKSSKRDIQMYKGPKGEVLSGEGKNPPFNNKPLKKGTRVLDIGTGKYETVKKNGGSVKKCKNGGSLSGLNASNKRTGSVDPKGAYTKVQKKALAGAKGKASLTKDKQLGATKMKNGGCMKCGGKMSKK